jgi:hypothetical protein
MMALVMPSPDAVVLRQLTTILRNRTSGWTRPNWNTIDGIKPECAEADAMYVRAHLPSHPQSIF